MGTILVVGAAGAEGGSVARHLLHDGDDRVRCLVPEAATEGLEALVPAEAELVSISTDQLADWKAVMAGCSGIFVATDYWELFDAEVAQGRLIAEAAAEVGIGHFVYSGQPSARDLTDGRVEVPQFETKAAVEAHIRGLALPATFLHMSLYYEAFTTLLQPRPQLDGSFTLGLPQGDVPLAAVSADDIGGVVAAVFRHPDRYIGRSLQVAGDEQPVSTYAAALGQATGSTVRYRHLPSQVFAAFGGFPGADDWAAMFDLTRSYGASRVDAIAECRSLFPALRTFDRWAADVAHPWVEATGPSSGPVRVAAVG